MKRKSMKQKSIISILNSWESYDNVCVPYECYYDRYFGGEIELNIETEQIRATSRKLKGEWTFEMDWEFA